MSYTMLMAIDAKNKTVEEFEEYPNSHGSAPPVWGPICKKYFGEEYHWLFHPEQLWPMWKDPRLPEYQRALLLMTYDRFYWSQEHFARAIADIKTFFSVFPVNPGHVNHWPRIIAAMETGPLKPGFGLYCCSVGENPWYGPWNEETEQNDPLNWEEVYEVYDEIDAENARQANGIQSS